MVKSKPVLKWVELPRKKGYPSEGMVSTSVCQFLLEVIPSGDYGYDWKISGAEDGETIISGETKYILCGKLAAEEALRKFLRKGLEELC